MCQSSNNIRHCCFKECKHFGSQGTKIQHLILKVSKIKYRYLIIAFNCMKHKLDTLKVSNLLTINAIGKWRLYKLKSPYKCILSIVHRFHKAPQSLTAIVVFVSVEEDAAIEMHVTNLVEEGSGNKGKKGVAQPWIDIF